MRKIFGKRTGQRIRQFFRDFDEYAVPQLVEAVGQYYGVPGAGQIYHGVREGSESKANLKRQAKQAVKDRTSRVLRDKYDSEVASELTKRRDRAVSKSDALRNQLTNRFAGQQKDAVKTIAELRGLGFSAQDITDAIR